MTNEVERHHKARGFELGEGRSTQTQNCRDERLVPLKAPQ